MFASMLLAYIPIQVPSWAEHPPSIDPVNFRLAFDHYNVGDDRPHPPGFRLLFSTHI
jgi:hypothetical protein